MPNNEKVKVGIIGSQFQADIHAASMKMASEWLEVVAVSSPTPGNVAALAKRYGIPRVFTDYREMLKERDIEMITIAAPNQLHAEMTVAAARAGKHVVCEKAPGYDSGRMRADDSCRQAGRRAVALCRRALFHSEIFKGQGDGRRWRIRQDPFG